MSNLILGLDVSTSVTGVCVLDPQIVPDDKGSHIIHLDRIEFKKFNTLWEKADYTLRCLSDIKNKFEGDYTLIIEEPLMGFQKGMSSAATITTLMRFNGITSYIARNVFGVDPVYIHAASARKTCGIKMQRTSIAGMSGKEQVFKYMSEHDLKHIQWPTKKNGSAADWSRDATDSYVIARAAMISGPLKND